MARQYYSNDKRTVAELLTVLEHGDVGQRKTAARELGLRGDISAVDALLAHLDDDPHVQSQAVLSLGMLGDPRAIDPLSRRLHDPLTVSDAARALVQIQSRRVVSILVPHLDSPHVAVRRNVALVLGETHDKRAVEPLIRRLTDEDPPVRKWAALSLGSLGDRRAGKALISTLTDPEPGVRCQAMRALGGVGEVAAIPLLLPILRGDRYGEELESAVGALGMLCSNEAVSSLLEILADSSPQNTSRYLAAVALGQIGNPEALEPLLTALRDDDLPTRVWAAHGLGLLGDVRAISQLRKAAKSDQLADEFGFTVADEATKAIRKIQRKRMKPKASDRAG